MDSEGSINTSDAPRPGPVMLFLLPDWGGGGGGRGSGCGRKRTAPGETGGAGGPGHPKGPQLTLRAEEVRQLGKDRGLRYRPRAQSGERPVGGASAEGRGANTSPRRTQLQAGRWGREGDTQRHRGTGEGTGERARQRKAEGDSADVRRDQTLPHPQPSHLLGRNSPLQSPSTSVGTLFASEGRTGVGGHPSLADTCTDPFRRCSRPAPLQSHRQCVMPAFWGCGAVGGQWAQAPCPTAYTHRGLGPSSPAHATRTPTPVPTARARDLPSLPGHHRAAVFLAENREPSVTWILATTVHPQTSSFQGSQPGRPPGGLLGDPMRLVHAGNCPLPTGTRPGERLVQGGCIWTQCSCYSKTSVLCTRVKFWARVPGEEALSVRLSVCASWAPGRRCGGPHTPWCTTTRL